MEKINYNSALAILMGISSRTAEFLGIWELSGISAVKSAHYYWDAHQFEKAERQFKKAVEIFKSKKRNKPHLQEKPLDALDELYNITNKHMKRFHILQQKLSYHQKTNSQLGQIRDYIGIAQCFHKQHEYDKASKYYDKALETAEEYFVSEALIDLYIESAPAFASAGRIAKSEKLLKKARKLSIKIDDPVRIALTAHQQGLIKMRNNQVQPAVTSLKEAIKILKNKREYIYLGMFNEDLAGIFSGLNDKGNEMRYLSQALLYYSKSVSLSKAVQIGSRLAELYCSAGDVYEGLLVLNKLTEKCKLTKQYELCKDLKQTADMLAEKYKCFSGTDSHLSGLAREAFDSLDFEEKKTPAVRAEKYVQKTAAGQFVGASKASSHENRKKSDAQKTEKERNKNEKGPEVIHIKEEDAQKILNEYENKIKGGRQKRK